MPGLSTFIHTYRREQQANRAQEEGEDRSRKRREIATLVFIILTTAGIFYQARILNRSDEAIQKSANAAKDAADAAKDANRIARETLETARRARISIVNLATRISDQGALVIDADLQNTGDIAATNTSRAAWVHIGPEIVVPSKDQFGLQLNSDADGQVIAPHETLHFHDERPNTVRFDQVERAKLGQLQIQAGLAIRYLDGFNYERTTWKTTLFDRNQGLFTYRGARQD